MWLTVISLGHDQFNQRVILLSLFYLNCFLRPEELKLFTDLQEENKFSLVSDHSSAEWQLFVKQTNSESFVEGIMNKAVTLRKELKGSTQLYKLF